MSNNENNTNAPVSLEISSETGKQLARVVDAVNDLVEHAPYEVGKTYYFRCVTFHYIGTVVKVGLFEILVKDVVWVAESEKFQLTLETGQLRDWMHYRTPKSPHKDDLVILARLSVVDASLWHHPSPPVRET